MAVYKADILDVELNTGNIARSFLCHNIGKDDTKADRFGVRVFRDGVAESLSGCSIQGYMMRPNGTNLAITGSNTGVSGNEAWVDLPQAAYDYEGQFCLALKLIGGGVTGTIRIIDGMINNTFVDDALVPMQSVPTYQEILAVYDQMVAAKNGSVRFDQSQSLTETQKSIARMNIDAARDSDVSDLKSAIQQTAEVSSQIVYNTGNIDGSYRTLTVKTDGYNITINGTSDATIKFKLSGGFASTASASYPDSWEKTIPLKTGHRYRLNSEIISGTYTSPNPPRVRIFDSSNEQIAELLSGESIEFDGNGNNALIYVYCPNGNATVNLKVRITLTDITSEYWLDQTIEQIQDEIRTETVKNLTLSSGGDYIAGSNPVGGTATLRTGSGYGVNGIVDVSFAEGAKITLEAPLIVANAQIVSMLCDASNKILRRWVTSNNMELEDGVYRGTYKVPFGAKYLMYSAYKGSSDSLTVHMEKAGINITRYVSVHGDDSADGMTPETPMATINKAIESGGKNILLAGGKYFQSINLQNASDALTISATNKDSVPVLYAPNSLISESETAVSGYTKVYSCPCSRTFDNKNIWLFQEGVADESTLISAADRHPLQRGKMYRCDDTKISVCSATTVADALSEIESANVYKWFLDAENSLLYFSRPSAVSADNPIMAAGGLLFANATRGLKLEMVGIGAKYQRFNLTDMIAPTLTDCFCGNVFGAAAFQWDSTVGIKLYRCEAFRVFYSSTSGDGFNAHSESTGEAFAKQTTSFLFDCWSHDNCDDGYSDHERCEISIFGGLFENNGAGVTPAVGSHCTCYNVLSRYNGEADFFYTGNPSAAEGGVGGQIACYGCVSKGAGTGRGFRLNGSEIQGLFVDCVVIGRQYGFFSESNGGTQVGTLINCSTVNCTTPKSAIFTAVNGVPVS